MMVAKANALQWLEIVFSQSRKSEFKIYLEYPKQDQGACGARWSIFRITTSAVHYKKMNQVPTFLTEGFVDLGVAI